MCPILMALQNVTDAEETHENYIFIAVRISGS